MLKLRIGLVCALAAVGLAACGSDAKTGASDTTAKATTTTAMGDMAGMDHGAAHEAGSHDAGNGKTDDLGLGMLHNGHHKQMVYTKLSAADQAAVDKLIAVSRPMAEKYPTLADAEKAGFRRAGPYSPGIGAHYTAPWAVQGFNPDGIMDAEDMAHPLIVIFDGVKPTSRFAGFMYYSASEKQPEGFPGKNDFWHYHTNVCTVFKDGATDAPFGADKSATKEMCDSVGGVLMEKTQWMVHVWSIPGYEVSDADGGMFAEANPKLKCPDGTYYVMSDSQMKDHPLNVCKSELS